MERVAVLFDIDDLKEETGSPEYGQQSWRIFFHAVEPQRLAGCALSHGDTDSTLAGRKRRYCWAIAVDCSSAAQASYVADAISKSAAKGLMPAGKRIASGRPAQAQRLGPPVARIDDAGRFVLADDAFLWLLIEADAAGWRHRVDPACLPRFVSEFAGRYQIGFHTVWSRETKLTYAHTFRESGGSDALKALKAALAVEKDPAVRKAYEEAIAGIRA